MVEYKNKEMTGTFFTIDTWEFIKGILDVWWLLAKELWWLWPILAAILIFKWGVVYLEKWIKNKRRIEKSKKQNKKSNPFDKLKAGN